MRWGHRGAAGAGCLRASEDRPALEHGDHRVRAVGVQRERSSTTIRGRDWPGPCTLCPSSTLEVSEGRRLRARHALRHGAVAASVLTVFAFTEPLRADIKTSPPQHVRLGFQATFPVSDMKSGSEPCVSYHASFDGSATFAVD